MPTASHNDSEHASQSSDCTSDSYSFTTEGSSMDERNLDHATRRKKRDKVILNEISTDVNKKFNKIIFLISLKFY